MHPDSTGPVDPVSIKEAVFNILSAMKPQAAAKRLNDAIIAGEAGLWQNDKEIDSVNLPGFFDRHLRIVVTKDETGGLTAKMSMIQAVSNFDETRWTMSAAQVRALGPQERVESKRGHDKYDWEEIALLFGKLVYDGEIDPVRASVNAAADAVRDHCKSENKPGDTQMRAKVKAWLNSFQTTD